MPVTLQFGPWAPDQSDTPIQVPDNPGPMMVPCADVLNVIYVNGNYKSIASPIVATINGNTIQAMNAQPVSAFSYFDQVAQQETVFTGTSTGVQQLNPDGSWSIVNLITTQITALIGQRMNSAFGSFANNDALRPVSLSFVTGAITPNIAGQAFVAGSMTVLFHGSQFKYVGYNQASGLASFGSLANSAPFSFGTFEALYDLNDIAPRCAFIVGAAADPGKSAFTTMTINAATQTSASCNYSYDASNQAATWSFPALFGLNTGSTYTVVLT